MISALQFNWARISSQHTSTESVIVGLVDAVG
jgi:hypothetical protein